MWELDPPPAGILAQRGWADGTVHLDRQAGGGGQPRRWLELPEWHSSGPTERLEGCRVDALGCMGRRATEQRPLGLREAGAARPPAWGPIATVAAAATLQAIVVIHVTAAANTVQLTGTKLHALDVHFLL